MNWGPEDYMAAFILFTFACFGFYLVTQYVKTKRNRIIGSILVGITFFLIWLELAVGIFS